MKSEKKFEATSLTGKTVIDSFMAFTESLREKENIPESYSYFTIFNWIGMAFIESWGENRLRTMTDQTIQIAKDLKKGLK